MRYRIFRDNTFVATKHTKRDDYLEAMQEIEADSSLVAEDIVYVDDRYYRLLTGISGLALCLVDLSEEDRKALYRQAYAADRAAAGVSK